LNQFYDVNDTVHTLGVVCLAVVAAGTEAVLVFDVIGGVVKGVVAFVVVKVCAMDFVVVTVGVVTLVVAVEEVVSCSCNAARLQR